MELVLQQGQGSYEGTRDATLYADRPENSNGGFALIFSGATVNSVRRGLIAFDLSNVSLPPKPWEVEVSLVLDRSGLFAPNGDVFSLHRVTTAWGEGDVATTDVNVGGLGEPAEPGDATWTHSAFGTQQWAIAGGDFLTSPSASVPVNRWDDVRQENNIYTFKSEDLARDLEEWSNNPEENHGWMLIGPEAVARNARRFWSSEAQDPALRPKLTIRSLAPESTTSLWAFTGS
ncbi:MAG: DNRLRE domain-containing protein [Candidatus Sumerlaeia bacterium]|nr:DNRLRE domain-containing protein [Candidatus Sumerlaeia bacterium]